MTTAGTPQGTTAAPDTFAIGGDLPVHRLGYGAMQITGKGIWGPPADHDGAIAVLRRAMELGVDFIDTADGERMYTHFDAGTQVLDQGAALTTIDIMKSVVNIGSISGLRASTLRVAYGTSKAALEHLTRQQAAELGNAGVRVNGVAPGPVDTAMAKQVHTPAIRADYHDAIPLNRYGTEAEIAAAVWFLCSDEASYINGQMLAVDGGFDATGIGLKALRAGP